MKKYYLFLLFAGSSLLANAQNKPVKILFDVTSKDSLTHQAVLRHVKGMSSAYENSSFEVVVYGGALSMVLKDKSTVSKAIDDVSGNKNVAFAVCAQTMKRYNIDKDQLLPGVQIVPSGVWAIGRAQENGCAYCYAGG